MSFKDKSVKLQNCKKKKNRWKLRLLNDLFSGVIGKVIFVVVVVVAFGSLIYFKSSLHFKIL